MQNYRLTCTSVSLLGQPLSCSLSLLGQPLSCSLLTAWSAIVLFTVTAWSAIVLFTVTAWSAIVLFSASAHWLRLLMPCSSDCSLSFLWSLPKLSCSTDRLSSVLVSQLGCFCLQSLRRLTAESAITRELESTKSTRLDVQPLSCSPH